MVGKVFQVKCNAMVTYGNDKTFIAEVVVDAAHRRCRTEREVKRCDAAGNRIREKLICSIVFSLAVKNHLKISCFRQFFLGFLLVQEVFLFWSAKQFPFGNEAHFNAAKLLVTLCATPLACDLVSINTLSAVGGLLVFSFHC